MDQTDKYGVPLCDLCEFKDRIIEVEKAEDYIIEDERLCSFIDDDECRATFVYGYQNATGKLQVWVQKTKECPVVVDILGIVLGVIGAIVAIGLFLILMWKIFTTIHDRSSSPGSKRNACWPSGIPEKIPFSSRRHLPSRTQLTPGD